MFYARPPDRDGDAPASCARHGRLGRWLWLVWLVVAIALALFFGHGLAAGGPTGVDRPGDRERLQCPCHPTDRAR